MKSMCIAFKAVMVFIGVTSCFVELGAVDIRTVGATPGADCYPSVVATKYHPDEVRLVVAFEYELTETDHDIYLGWSNNYGRDWNLRQASTAKCDERHPRMALGLDDTLHLVFQSDDTLGWIYASAYSLGWVKTSWAETWSDGCRHPDVAADPVSNTIWFVMEQLEGTNHDILACYMDNVARTYQTLTVVQDAKDEMYPVVACDMNNVLVLYEYHDGVNVDVKGELSKTSSPSFSAVEVAQTQAKEYHPEIVSTSAGFEYAYQTDDSLYYGFSPDGTSHVITPAADISGDVSPAIDADANAADICFRKDSTTLVHLRVTGQNPSSGIAYSEVTVNQITEAERQTVLATIGDSCFCVWSGTPGIGSSNIYGIWWSLQNAFAVSERLNPDYDPELAVSPGIMSTSCRISFIPSGEGLARLAIFDASGRMVRNLLSKKVLPAYFTFDWDGRDDAGRGLPNGVYLVKLWDVGGERQAKVVLLR